MLYDLWGPECQCVSLLEDLELNRPMSYQSDFIVGGQHRAHERLRLVSIGACTCIQAESFNQFAAVHKLQTAADKR
jgi:hypothetical protein